MMKSDKDRNRTWVEVDLGAIGENVRKIKERVKPVKVLACLKADGYGLGALPIAKEIERDVDIFGLATIREAKELRKGGIKKPLFILGTILPEEAKEAVKNDLILTLCSEELTSALSKEGKRQNKEVRVHLKVDTGMGRLGILPSDVFPFVKEIQKLPNLSLEGIFSHFPSADRDINFSKRQLNIFLDLIKELERRGIEFCFRHIANSSAVLNLPESYLDKRLNLVRVGLLIYGLYPSLKERKKNLLNLKPALSLKSRIISLKEGPKGWGISYGRTYRTKKRTKIAIIPCGYADGYSFALSNKGYLIIEGERCPVLGRVCMDQMVVGVDRIKNLKIGEVATLIGKDKRKEITVEELAEIGKTIPYEIVSRLSHRLPRFYK